MVINARTEFELVKRLNESEMDFFATQPKLKKDGTWACFCYYNKVSEKPKEEKKEFRPNVKMASEYQKDYIYRNNLNVDTENLTSKKAFDIIAKHKAKEDEKK